MTGAVTETSVTREARAGQLAARPTATVAPRSRPVLRDLGLRETGLPRSVSSLTTSWLTRTRFWLARLWWDPGSTQQASRLSQRDDRFGDDPVVEALRETLYYKVLQLLRVTQILEQRL